MTNKVNALVDKYVTGPRCELVLLYNFGLFLLGAKVIYVVNEYDRTKINYEEYDSHW